MRRVRPMVFETRTAFPVSAACVVANGVRETLCALLQSTVELRLFEPTVPSKNGWRAIVDGARLYRVAGTRANAAIVIRPAACIALATAAFGETGSGARPLSSVETTVLDRIVNAVAANFAAVCGARPEGVVPQPVTDIDGFLTYFELALERPVPASIGVAVQTYAQRRTQRRPPCRGFARRRDRVARLHRGNDRSDWGASGSTAWRNRADYCINRPNRRRNHRWEATCPWGMRRPGQPVCFGDRTLAMH